MPVSLPYAGGIVCLRQLLIRWVIYQGNTPLHLAMESGHGDAAVVLIEAGADRERSNSEGQVPEEIEGVGGQEQKKVREYVASKVGRRIE